VPRVDPPRNARDIAGDLRRVIDYFRGIGVNINRGRIQLYLSTLDAAGRGEPVDRGLLWSAACEVADLVQIVTLDPNVLAPVSHRLAGIPGGDPTYKAASGEDPGRNLCFELITAATLQAGGQRSQLQNPSDVTNTIAGSALLVECKRPTTNLALGRCLKKGYKQLSEHRRNGHTGYGVIALDVSALVNPDFGILIDVDAASAVRAVYGHIQRVFGRASEHLARAARSSRADAGVHLLMFRVRCMTGDGKSPANTTVVWHLEPVVRLDSAEFRAIYEAMSRQPAFTPGVIVLNADDARLPRA